MIARRKRMEHELLDGRQISLVALEDTASNTQKCFIAFDSSVCVSKVVDVVISLLLRVTTYFLLSD